MRRHAWRRRVRLALTLVMTSGLLSTTAAGYQRTRNFFAIALPGVAHLDVWDVLHGTPTPPRTLTMGGHAAAAPWGATADDLRNSPVLWRRMHLADWNAIPEDLRHESLATMLDRHRDLLASPAAWARMTPDAWDFIPQPIRIVAYRQMVDYWTHYYRVGERYALPDELVSETLAAIVMSESWFDHRAGVTYVDGTSDMGLAQASDFARDRLRRLAGRGVVDVAWEDEDYRNPWHATRFVAVWMALMLDEANGDLDVAVRAYHRGIARAGDALGTKYLKTVQQRLNRYIRNADAPPAWDFVWRRAREIAIDVSSARASEPARPEFDGTKAHTTAPPSPPAIRP